MHAGVHRQHTLCTQRPRDAHRQRRAPVGIQVQLAADTHWRKLALDGGCSLNRQARITRGERHGGTITPAHCHTGHGHRHAFEQRHRRLCTHQIGHCGAAQFFIAAQCKARKIQGLQLQRQLLDRVGAHARSPQTANQRTHGRTHDQVGLQAHLLQRFQHPHMGEPARPARTEHPGGAHRAAQRAIAWSVRAAVVLARIQGAACQRGCAGQQE